MPEAGSVVQLRAEKQARAEQPYDFDPLIEDSRTGVYYDLHKDMSQEEVLFLERISFHVLSESSKVVVQFYCDVPEDGRLNAQTVPFVFTREAARHFLQEVRNGRKIKDVLQYLLSEGKNVEIHVRKYYVDSGDDHTEITTGHESVKYLFAELFKD